MRYLLGFLSLVALGLMLAVAVALGTSGLAGTGERAFRLDYPSLLLGLGLGVVIATLARLSWSEMPRRAALWLVANEKNFYRLGFAALCLGVLFY